MNDGDDVRNHIEFVNLWPPAETKEDIDFVKNALNEISEIYGRIIMVLECGSAVSVIFVVAYAMTYGLKMSVIVSLIIILLIGIFTFFLPEKKFVRKALFYWYERKMRDNNEGCMGGMSSD